MYGVRYLCFDNIFLLLFLTKSQPWICYGKSVKRTGAGSCKIVATSDVTRLCLFSILELNALLPRTPTAQDLND